MSFSIFAGPCALENESMALKTASFLSELQIPGMRACIFKMRTCPKSWRGLEDEGLPILAKIKQEFPQLKLICEIRSIEDWSKISGLIDIFQIGTRNAQNFDLIEKVGQGLQPHQRILLKRGMGNTLKEFRDAALYAGSYERVLLCERGIRTFERETRNTLDISTIPVLKQAVPGSQIFVDPSHSAGDSRYVVPLMGAAKAAGADGLLVEVHPDPAQSRTDSKQSISFSDFSKALRWLDSIEGFDYDTH